MAVVFETGVVRVRQVAAVVHDALGVRVAEPDPRVGGEFLWKTPLDPLLALRRPGYAGQMRATRPAWAADVRATARAPRPKPGRAAVLGQ